MRGFKQGGDLRVGLKSLSGGLRGVKRACLSGALRGGFKGELRVGLRGSLRGGLRGLIDLFKQKKRLICF